MHNKKKAMILALEKNLGIITSAIKVVGIGRRTHYLWMKEDEEYRAAVEEIQDIVLDFAESKLYELIKNCEPSAIYFYLKTKGRKRGYSERIEIDKAQDDKPIIINFPENFQLPSSEAEAEKNI
jgi:hypothetical protein